MALLRKPAACLERAVYFAKWAATSASPSARDRLARIAKNWSALASKVEMRGTIPDCCGDVSEKKRHSGSEAA